MFVNWQNYKFILGLKKMISFVAGAIMKNSVTDK